MLITLNDVNRKNIVIVLAEHPFKLVVGLIQKLEQSLQEKNDTVELTDNDIELIYAVCDEATHKVAKAILVPLEEALNATEEVEIVEETEDSGPSVVYD